MVEGSPPQLRARRVVRALRISGVTLVMVLAVQFVAGGYEYGFGEQVLLSLKGISWADPTAYVGDWFNDRAPQPHILFDVITYLSEMWGVRPWAYFAYWLTSIAVTAWGVVLLSDRWLPRRLRPFELLVGLLIVIGPYFALGTFLVVHREAVPNGLGGALGFLTAVFLVTRRDRAAVVAALLTAVVHVQHGSVVAVLLLVAWLIDRDRLRRPVVRWFPGVAAVILGLVYLVARVRGLVSGTGDVSAICETASPGHCDPDSWAWPVIRDGLAVLALGALAPFLSRRAPSLRAVSIIAVPALIAVTALATDLANIQPFESLGRQLFLYRFVMVVAPFAPWSIVLGLCRPLVRRLNLGSALLCLGGLAALVWWLQATYATMMRFRPSMAGVNRAGLLLGIAIAIVVVVWAVLGPRIRSWRPLWNADLAVSWVMVAAAVASLLWFGGRVTGFVPLRIDYRSDEGAVTVGREIERAIPPGSVLAARPDIGWTRLLSRRAVVVDCKGVPYGGVPWREYNERLVALGVPTPLACGNAGFAALQANDIQKLRARFGATHVLLDVGDAALAEVEGRWTKVFDGGPPAHTSIFEIPADPKH
jgi:hypothetical protein